MGRDVDEPAQEEEDVEVGHLDGLFHLGKEMSI
jgi:hypothetical protein